MTARDELVAILDAVDFNHDPGSGDYASNEEYADAILANWTPQTVTAEQVEAAARAETPSQWSVYDEALARGGERDFPAEYIVRPSIERVLVVLSGAGFEVPTVDEVNARLREKGAKS